MPLAHHFLSTPLLGLLTVTSDFARHSAPLTVSLIPPTFFAENGFLQPMIFLLAYDSLFSFCLGNISPTYLRAESLRKGTYGNALVDVFKKLPGRFFLLLLPYRGSQEKRLWEQMVVGSRGQGRAGCAREESANCWGTSSHRL